MAGFNKTALAAVEALHSAELAISQAAIRAETSYLKDFIDDMAEHLSEFQESVENERGFWNMLAGGAGCIIGGIAGGIAGGGQGAAQGCKTGSKVTTIASDYVYDSDKWDTPKEKALKAYANEFEELDINLSQVAKRFLAQGGYETEEKLEGYYEQYWDDYETWEEGFYGKEGHDYGMEFLGATIDLAMSEGGQNIYDQTFKSTPTPEIDDDYFSDYDPGTDFDPDIDTNEPYPGDQDVGSDEPIYYDPYKSSFAPGYAPSDILNPNEWTSYNSGFNGLDDWYSQWNIDDSIFDEWNLGGGYS